MIARLLSYMLIISMLLPTLPAWATTDPCDTAVVQSTLPPGVTVELVSCVNSDATFRYVKADGTEVQPGETIEWIGKDIDNPLQDIEISWTLEPSVEDDIVSTLDFQAAIDLPNSDSDQQVVAKGSFNGGALSEVGIFLDGATNTFYAQILGMRSYEDKVLDTFPLGDLGLTFPSGSPGSSVRDLQIVGPYQFGASDVETRLGVYNPNSGDFTNLVFDVVNGDWQVVSSSTTNLASTIPTWPFVTLAGPASTVTTGVRDRILAIDTNTRDVYLIDPLNPTNLETVSVGADLVPAPYGPSFDFWDTLLVKDIDQDGKTDDIVLGYATASGSDTLLNFRGLTFELASTGTLIYGGSVAGSTLLPGSMPSDFRAATAADKFGRVLLTRKVNVGDQNMYLMLVSSDGSNLFVDKTPFPSNG